MYFEVAVLVEVIIGLGKNGFSNAGVPPPSFVDVERVHDIPVVFGGFGCLLLPFEFLLETLVLGAQTVVLLALLVKELLGLHDFIVEAFLVVEERLRVFDVPL